MIKGRGGLISPFQYFIHQTNPFSPPGQCSQQQARSAKTPKHGSNIDFMGFDAQMCCKDSSKLIRFGIPQGFGQHQAQYFIPADCLCTKRSCNTGITTTGLAGGLSWPYKGLFPAALVERLKRLSAALLSRLLLKQLTRGLFYRLTRKRVNILFYTYLVCDHVFLDLILYILFYFLCIFPYRIDEVTSTPEVP